MRKADSLWSFLLVRVLLGTVLLGAGPSWHGGGAALEARGHSIIPLPAGRLPAHDEGSQANSSVKASPPSPPEVNISYQDARTILDSLDSHLLPGELQGRSPAERAQIWPGWVTRHDQEMRARLMRGDEDSLVNFLVLGTSFTRQPRLSPKELTLLMADLDSSHPSADDLPQAGVLSKRIEDLLRGMANPGENERVRFVSQLVEKQGYRPREAYGVHPNLAERARLKGYVLANVARVLKEQKGFQEIYEQARQQDGRPENLAATQTLYHSRGVSLDTSLWPNLAIEESLKAMEGRGLLAPGSVRRAAVIGPGLDFTDKAGGYDFYPQQTIQCFALTDTLFRLGLAQPGKLEVFTFDISPRVNDHLNRARRRADLGQPYVLQLPRDTHVPWKASTSSYWQQFGDQIGDSVTPIPPPTLAGSVEARAVQIRPASVALITPVDLDIVTQHLDLLPQKGFDLIISTNVFCYFDSFEQLMAVANAQSMLRPGGFLLSNTVLPLLPSLAMRSVSDLLVEYSDLPDDGDVIIWYQRSPDH